MINQRTEENILIHKLTKLLETSRSQQIYDRIDTADILQFLIVSGQLLDHLANKYDHTTFFNVRIYEKKDDNPLEEIKYSLCPH